MTPEPTSLARAALVELLEETQVSPIFLQWAGSDTKDQPSPITHPKQAKFPSLCEFRWTITRQRSHCWQDTSKSLGWTALSEDRQTKRVHADKTPQCCWLLTPGSTTMGDLNETGTRLHQNTKTLEKWGPSVWVTWGKKKINPRSHMQHASLGTTQWVSSTPPRQGWQMNSSPPNQEPKQTKSWLPFPSRGVPESVNKVFMIFSKLQLGSMFSGSSAKCFSISRRTSSKDVAVSSRMMLALAKKPSRSRWALTSSSKFFNFRYCVEKRSQHETAEHNTSKVKSGSFTRSFARLPPNQRFYWPFRSQEKRHFMH